MMATTRHCIASVAIAYGVGGRQLFSRRIVGTGLKAIADARLGDEKAWVIGIGFNFLPQFANENSQVLYVVSLSAAPDFPEQMVVRHHEADMHRQNMKPGDTLFWSV